MTTTTQSGPPPLKLTGPRAEIKAKTLRRDAYWVQPAITVAVLVAFIIYSTIRALMNRDYYKGHLISPFYSPCLSYNCGKVPGSAGVPHLGWFGTWDIITPAVIILIFPLGFRLTCYYYRKAYYRSFWASPPACAVAEPHKKYTGETRFPLIGQNVHRYFFLAGLVFNAILTYDAVDAWQDAGLGSIILTVNAGLLWCYSLSCHSCRHIIGGRLKHFSKHPLRYQGWMFVSKLNRKHMQLAWVSLIGVALTDVYVLLVSSNAFSDPRF